MKLKNLFKTFALFALVLPCALIFTACGDNSVSVNTKGNYVETTSTEVNAYLEDMSEPAIFTGYKFTSVSDVEMSGMKLTTKINGIVTVDDQESLDMKLDITMKSGKEKVSESAYVQDNIMYLNVEGQKIRVDLTDASGDYSDIINSVPSFDSFEGLISLPENIFKVYKNGDTVKYEITYQEVEDDSTYDSVMYLVFENDVLTGVQMNTTVQYSTDYKVTTTMNIVTYEGTIEFPSFEGYTDFSQILPSYPQM